MGNPDDSKKEKKGEKKRQRISSSSGNENSEIIQDGAFVTLKLTEYQALLDRLKAVEDTMKEREKHILQLEARLCEAETSINKVKTECSSVAESLTYAQKEQDDLKERMSLCENELSAQGDEISKQSVYSRRWNLIFYRIPEFSGEDCALLVKNVLTDNLKLEEAEVRSMKFCGVHRIGQHRRSKIRPIIVRFTCRADRDKVWKCRYALKHSSVSVGEDLPKAIQDIRTKVLLPAMKKAKETPSTKATIVGDRLIVNGKSYFHYQIPEKWQVNQQVPQQQVEEQGES